MTGPEHYAVAEHLLGNAQGREITPATATAIATLAQVHATLALAASHADPRAHEDEWKRVTS